MTTIPPRFCMYCEVKKAQPNEFFCSRDCLIKYNNEKWRHR